MIPRKERLAAAAKAAADAAATAPCAAAALVGASAGRTPGSFTYKNLILKGIPVLELTNSEINEIHAAGAITFVTKAGDNVTTEGKAASGEYIDIVDSKDFIISNMEYGTQKLLNSLPKIPYDNTGIAQLENVAINVLKAAFDNGIIAADEDGSPMFSVNYAMRDEVNPADRSERQYLGGRFSFVLAGAVHNVTVTGELII